MNDWDALFAALRADGIDIPADTRPRAVGGGDISAAWKLGGRDRAYFLKTGPAARGDMFEAEAAGLRELAAANALRVPGVFSAGVAGERSYLLLEWLDFTRGNAAADALLGERLAAQHRRTSERYGWHRDNTIGATAQQNAWSDDWIEFFRERRLRFQLELACRNGHGGELQREGARLLGDLPRFFDAYRPQASLLHGDLWGGNWAVADGQPVVFDPAVYYGDRETDLAMTRLFGGFGNAFYSAYAEAWPLAAGHEKRLPLYQLYHVLNHLNLFGGGYRGRAVSILRALNR